MAVIQEKRKSKPIGIKKLIVRLFISAVSGLVCGAFVLGVLVHFKEEIKAMFKTESGQTIVIGTGSDQNDDTQQDSSDIIISDVDVEAWQMVLYQKGADLKNALVEVVGAKESNGIIFSSAGESIIVLVSNCGEGTTVKLRFCDGVVANGEVVGRDDYTGLAVVFVRKTDVTPITLSEIKVIRWGDSLGVQAGKYVIAVGSPLGEPFTTIVGVVTGNAKTITTVDREHEVLMTNIASRTNASGFLLDEEGALLGVITHKADVAGQVNWIGALAISDISDLVELLANRKLMPYLGIDGITVTDTMNHEYGVPDGIYVNGVIEESPALQGNIQAGDVITMVDGNKVLSVKELKDILFDKQPGDGLDIVVKRLINGTYTEMAFHITVGRKMTEGR